MTLSFTGNQENFLFLIREKFIILQKEKRKTKENKDRGDRGEMVEKTMREKNHDEPLNLASFGVDNVMM